MPFTFSHPAVVIPLTFIDKKRLSVTALTVGSITPDFEYFANFKQHSIYSHTWLGIFWWDVPVSMLLFYLYTRVVKNVLVDNLPSFLNSRFSGFKNLKRITSSRQKNLIIFTSLLIGITSHLLWDKLLHKSVQLAEEPMEFYPLYWDANSVIGAAVIAFIVWQLPKSNIAVKHDKFLFWFVTLFITLIVLLIRAAHLAETRDQEVTVISGLLIGLPAASVITKWFGKRQQG